MQFFFQQYIRVYRSIITKLNEILVKHELSFSLWEVLHYINKNGPSTLVEISNYYHVEKPSITRRVQRLTEQGLVEGVQTKDRREKKIHLTDTGKEVYKECRGKINKLEDEVMQNIPESDKNTLFKTLPLLQQNIQSKEVESE